MHVISSMHTIACGSAFLCNQAMDSVIIITCIDPAFEHLHVIIVILFSAKSFLIPASDDKGPFQTDWTEIRPSSGSNLFDTEDIPDFFYLVNLYILKKKFL